MKTVAFSLAILGIRLVTAPASAVLVPLSPASLPDLLGSPQPIDVVQTTPMETGDLKSVVYSQAYANGEGLYAYLYQLENTGSPGNSILEQFTVIPFEGADENIIMGYLTGTSPAGFLPGPAHVPEPQGNINIPSGPVVSFYFGDRYGDGIDIAEHSAVMYVLSRVRVGQIIGNVIAKDVAFGPVVGPVPEPSTVALFATGAAIAFLRRKK